MSLGSGATNNGKLVRSRFAACATFLDGRESRLSEAVVIKTTTLFLLGWRYLRSNRKAAAGVLFSQALVWARLKAKRVHNRWKLLLPAILVSFRAALGPGIILVGLGSRRGAGVPSLGRFCTGWGGGAGVPSLGRFCTSRGGSALLAACIVLALVSDVLDGVLARWWRIDTENLRRWDTRADTLFYFCVLVVAGMRYPSALKSRWLLIAGLLTAEVATHVFAIVKFGRHASYHSALSKIWGLLLAAAMIALFGLGVDNWFLDVAIGWGILCNLQGLAMTLLLPVWQRDIPTLFHAMRLRRQLTRPGATPRRSAPSRAWW